MSNVCVNMLSGLSTTGETRTVDVELPRPDDLVPHTASVFVTVYGDQLEPSTLVGLLGWSLLVLRGNWIRLSAMHNPRTGRSNHLLVEQNQKWMVPHALYEVGAAQLTLQKTPGTRSPVACPAQLLHKSQHCTRAHNSAAQGTLVFGVMIKQCFNRYQN